MNWTNFAVAVQRDEKANLFYEAWYTLPDERQHEQRARINLFVHKVHFWSNNLRWTTDHLLKRLEQLKGHE